MILHPRSFLEHLEPADCAAVLDASYEILAKTGFIVQNEEASRALSEAGASVKGGGAGQGASPVTIPRPLAERLLALAPRAWSLHARNPRRTVEVGTNRLLVSPGYGSPSVVDEAGTRRDATLHDFQTFAGIAARADCIDITGGLLVEPLDVPPALRSLETTRALLAESDKPLFGSVAGREGARDSIELARMVFPDLERRPVLIGLVNINSPLRLDARMAEALVEYARAGQAVLLTPGILMGVTAPVTVAGAAAQAFAELVACVCVTQAVRPGAPVMLGTGGFGADLRSGGPGFGRPENAIGTAVGAQLARALGLPFRCSGAVTGARLPDCRSGYERMMTALAAWTSGAHLCLQGAGTLDSINSMSCSQFLIDVEIWGYIQRLAGRPSVDRESLALEVIASRPVDYLGCDHTVEHLRRELLSPLLAPPLAYADWVAAGAPSVVDIALTRVRDAERNAAAGTGLSPGVQPLPQETLREMEQLIRSRRRSA